MDQDKAKREVGRTAAERVDDGMVLGLGTGSTVAHFLDALGERVSAGGLSVVGVPTSARTAEHCKRLGIRLTTLEEHPTLDLCIDGADEVAPGLQLIKGGGGALLREKIVATASERFLVIVDETKEVDRLGSTFRLPVEVVPYALPTVRRALEDLSPEVRLSDGRPATTDNGNLLLDLATGPLEEPHAIAGRLREIVGVVEHGLFLDMADACLVATPEGVRERTE